MGTLRNLLRYLAATLRRLRNSVLAVFGQAMLDRASDERADDIRSAELDQTPCLTSFAEDPCRKSWKVVRPGRTPIEATIEFPTLAPARGGSASGW
jgi:hypothetical protein